MDVHFYNIEIVNNPLSHITLPFFHFFPHPPSFTLLQNGMTPMHMASREGHLEVVKALKEMGGDPNAKDNVREGGGVIGWGI